MRIRHLVPALFLVASSAFADSMQAPNNVVHVSASSTAEAQYDLLSLVLSTTADGTGAQVVQQKLKLAVDSALKAARTGENAEDMSIRTGGFTISPRYDKDGRISGWQGSAEIILEGKDMARIGATAGKVITMTVSSSRFLMSQSLLAQLESKVQGQAIDSFKSKSRQVAQSFGFHNFTLQQVTVNTNNQNPGPRPMMAMKSMALESASSPIPIEAGKGSLMVTVSGTIQLTN